MRAQRSRERSQGTGNVRVRRGWNAMSSEEKAEWLAKKRAEAEMLTDNVTSAVIDLINRKQTSSSLGWRDSFVPPQNIIYGRRYTGVNALSLTMQAFRRGQRDCRFLTRNALRNLKDKDGGRAQLLPGAEPYLVMSPRRMADRKLQQGCDASAYSPDRLEEREDGLWLKGQLFFSTVRVYSVADTTAAVPPLESPPLLDFEENSFFEAVFDAFGVRTETKIGQGACYSRIDDCIILPPREEFESSDMYYATILHEFYHWTGHPDREARVRDIEYGSSEYAREEVRAELFSAITSVMFGLKDTLRQSAGYIEQWSNTLAGRQKEIFAMAAEVQQMASALYDLADGRRPEPAWMQGYDFSRVPSPVLDAAKEGRSIEEAWRRDLGLGLGENADEDKSLAARSLPAAQGREKAAVQADARNAAQNAVQEEEPGLGMIPGF